MPGIEELPFSVDYEGGIDEVDMYFRPNKDMKVSFRGNLLSGGAVECGLDNYTIAVVKIDQEKIKVMQDIDEVTVWQHSNVWIDTGDWNRLFNFIGVASKLV